jgi:hypothetical protein
MPELHPGRAAVAMALAVTFGIIWRDLLGVALQPRL